MAETASATGHHHPYGSSAPPHSYPPVTNMYPYLSGGSASSYQPYPTPTHPPRYSSSVVPWSSSHHHGGYHEHGGGGGGGGGRGGADCGGNRALMGPSRDPTGGTYGYDPHPAAPDVMPYEVPPPYEYPTPAFDRRYYPRNPSPVTGHHHHHHHPGQLPHHPPPAAATQQIYHPALYPHQPSPPCHGHPLASNTGTPMHQVKMQCYSAAVDAAAAAASAVGTRGNHPVRRISILPPAPEVAARTTAMTNQDGVPQVTTHKKKSQSKLANLASHDKSPTTMSFERILECATLIATGPRRSTPALLSESEGSSGGGNQLRAEDATNLAERLASAGGEREATRDDSGSPANPMVSSSLSIKRSPELLARQQQQQQIPAAPTPTGANEEVEDDPFHEIAHDPVLYKAVVLRMALQRQAFDEPRVRDFTVSPVIGPGFFWRDYLPMEQVLYENMADYFDVSAGQRQSKLQQSFTRRLLDKVREVADENGWTFSGALGEKVLRDRIRCFYKTHLQNAKKRLVTLQKHPDSQAHRSALRVYVRSVRLEISVEESQLREPALRAKCARGRAPSVVASPFGDENEGRPAVRRGEIFTTLQKAHQVAPKSSASTPLAGCERNPHGLSDALTTIHTPFRAGSSNHGKSNGLAVASEAQGCAYK